MTTFEKFQTIASFIAIGISILSIIYTSIVSKKQTKLKMKENYYEPIFKDMLLIKLSQVFTDFVDIKKNKVYPKASDNFEKAIGEFRKRIKFLQFMDFKTYNIIDNLLISIDENIVLLCCNVDNKEEKIQKTHNLVKKLYNEINKYYKFNFLQNISFIESLFYVKISAYKIIL